jgi:Peptidase family M48
VTLNKIHDTYILRFFKNKRIVMYDTLIDQVELPELLAILGHEIGHWQLSHALQGFVVVQVIEISFLNGMTVTAEFHDLIRAGVRNGFWDWDWVCVWSKGWDQRERAGVGPNIRNYIRQMGNEVHRLNKLIATPNTIGALQTKPSVLY